MNKTLHDTRTPVALIGDYRVYSFIVKPRMWRQGDYVLQEYTLVYRHRTISRVVFPMCSDMQHERALVKILNNIK